VATRQIVGASHAIREIYPEIEKYVNRMCEFDAKGNNAIKDVNKREECEKKYNRRKLIEKSRDGVKKRTDIFRTERRDLKNLSRNWLVKFY
jgi:hypothetical protein